MFLLSVETNLNAVVIGEAPISSFNRSNEKGKRRTRLKHAALWIAASKQDSRGGGTRLCCLT